MQAGDGKRSTKNSSSITLTLHLERAGTSFLLLLDGCETAVHPLGKELICNERGILHPTPQTQENSRPLKVKT